MRYKYNFIKITISTLGLLFLTACQKQPAEETVAPATPSPTPFGPQTEAEYRQAISELENDTASLKQVVEYYEQLLAMDVFTEGDYSVLADLYAQLGEQENQKKMLSKVQRLYPSDEYVEKLGSLIWEKDASDETAAGLVGQLTAYMESDSTLELRTLIISEDWKEAFQDELVGVQMRTKYLGEGQTVQILSDAFETEIFVVSDDGNLLYCRSNEAGSKIVHAGYADSGYQGAFTVSYYDPEGNLVRRNSGTMSDNVCVEDILITYEGEEYMGHFDAEGRTTEEQEESVTKLGGVVYAYGSDKNTYLYAEDATVDTFRMSREKVGLPVYIQW